MQYLSPERLAQLNFDICTLQSCLLPYLFWSFSHFRLSTGCLPLRWEQRARFPWDGPFVVRIYKVMNEIVDFVLFSDGGDSHACNLQISFTTPCHNKSCLQCTKSKSHYHNIIMYLHILATHYWELKFMMRYILQMLGRVIT